MDVPCTADVGDEHQVEVGVAIDGEPYSSFLLTWDPVKNNPPSKRKHSSRLFLLLPAKFGDNTSPVLSNLQEGGLGQVEVLQGRVAPPSVVIRQGEVWRAEVGRSDHDAAWPAPPGVVVASHLVAGPAAQAIVEQSSTECSSQRAVALTRRVAPPSVVVRQGVVGGAEVGGSDCDAARPAPLGVVIARHLIARPAAEAIVKESGAECSSECAIPLAVQVAIATSSPCSKISHQILN
ncbi:hypothetical protein EJ110_NYTH45351 [Nymphaea thermarum]|nr:hypothetical protein EJ110_NYTH45351 [Nymphaea thermarum]